MKVTAYIRIGKKEPGSRGPRAVVDAGSQPNSNMLYQGPNPIPTVAFGVDLDIPDELFERASQVIAEIVIPVEAAEIAAEVKQD